VPVPTRRAQALLACLALKPGQPQLRDKLASLLWDVGHEQARNNLRQTIFTIRRALADVGAPTLVADGEALTLDMAHVRVDAIEFERLRAAGDMSALEAAASLYCGDLLEGFSVGSPAFEEWLLAERERLRELACESMRRLLDGLVGAGALDRATPIALRLLALDPLQETIHRALMDVYARQERWGAAQRQYEQCAAILKRELGVPPEPETEALRQSILNRRRRRALPGGRPEADRHPAVLLVDDDAVTRAAVEGILTGAGYDVVVCVDGADALYQLGQHPFDVIVSDIMMPTLDGIQLLQFMRGKALRVPTIFITAAAEERLEARGFDLGAADYIRKPVRRDVLLARLRNVLAREKTR
jgi:DNA-binding SARP family transcriptional activator